jgi:basic membrane lipoprotein Med (substrate-binding protein (PBP1-ABC) superfamily)
MKEGIRDPIKVYEYMNKFYVLEGNKRVSVLKYFQAVTVNAEVIRKVPKKSDDPDIKIYYEFMDFYKCTKINDLYFSKVGSFPSFMKLIGIKNKEPLDQDAKRDLVSCMLKFRNAYDARGGERFDFPAGDAFLRFIHIHGYKNALKMTSDEMNKNVAKTWGEFELLSENSAVDLKMSPVDEPKKNILSFLLPKPGSGNKKLKVGFIYEKTPQDSEWCYTHELGRQYIEDTFGTQIETTSITNVEPDVGDTQAIEQMVKDKVDLIFVTSPSMIMASLKEAIAHPDVKILNCSLNTSHKYIRTYYARMYEAKFLTGIIAGALADKDKIGYIAGYPIYGAVANINAFALGAKFVNPRAKIYLEWSSVKDRDIEQAFRDEGVRYVSDQDMITPQSASRKFGLYKLESHGRTQHIAMPVWHWGMFYEKLIQSIMSGSWKREEDTDSAKALNYWWGISAKVVDIIASNKLPVEVQRNVNVFKKMICTGEFEPFAGLLIDQNKKVRNKLDQVMNPEQIITMDWLLDNVVGTIPELKDLKEGSEAIVMAQGIIKNK